jgi:hypothetical protein
MGACQGIDDNRSQIGAQDAPRLIRNQFKDFFTAYAADEAYKTQAGSNVHRLDRL